MNLDNISVPEIYTTSEDFRFFLRWFKMAISKVKYDTENLPDLYDPLKCPEDLLWMLADTMGYKYDDRLPTAFNRLVLMYFMSMIRNRGSKDGITIAAETNLAQFNLLEYGKENSILYNRLEDTSIPVNMVYVTPHVERGEIDVVYFSTEVPIDACIEYVRPVGMYLNQYAGVKFDGKTKISIDARLTNLTDKNEDGNQLSIGSTRVGHYSREDYARLQKTKDNNLRETVDTTHKREKVYERNEAVEGSSKVDAGYRALYSVQLCNNEHIIRSTLNPIFGLGYIPQPDDVGTFNDKYILPDTIPPSSDTTPPKSYYTNNNIPIPDGDGGQNALCNYNLRYDKTEEEKAGTDVFTVENIETEDSDKLNPKPAVNPIMSQVGEAMIVEDSQGKRHKVVLDSNGRPTLGEEV